MKLLITWLKKNGNCRCWTNGKIREHLVMAMVSLKEGARREAQATGKTEDEAFHQIFRTYECESCRDVTKYIGEFNGKREEFYFCPKCGRRIFGEIGKE